MTLAPIMLPHHCLARFAKRAHTDTKADGSVVVSFAAFLWAKAAPDDHGLSVNWLDYFPGDKEARLGAVRSSMHMTPGSKDRLALLEIGQLTTHLYATAGLNVVPLCDPTGPNARYPYRNPSHAVISGLPDENYDSTRAQQAATLIAKDCVIEHVPARSPHA